MPTPFGHAIGGLAAAFLINSTARRPRLTMPILVASAALAVAPDLDILVGTHRAHTHSVGAIAAVGAVAWLALRGRVADAWPWAAVLTAAYGSHALLDLLGRDTRIPRGLTVLWPFSDTYYMSRVSIFSEVSRRYWLPGEFIFSNLRGLAWELAVLVPVLLVAWAFWSRRTLKS
jgi:LexA-binding, inner membrane-associated putative hydrolase